MQRVARNPCTDWRKVITLTGSRMYNKRVNQCTRPCISVRSSSRAVSAKLSSLKVGELMDTSPEAQSKDCRDSLKDEDGKDGVSGFSSEENETIKRTRSRYSKDQRHVALSKDQRQVTSSRSRGIIKRSTLSDVMKCFKLQYLAFSSSSEKCGQANSVSLVPPDSDHRKTYIHHAGAFHF